MTFSKKTIYKLLCVLLVCSFLCICFASCMEITSTPDPDRGGNTNDNNNNDKPDDNEDGDIDGGDDNEEEIKSNSTEGLYFALNADNASYTLVDANQCTAEEVLVDYYNNLPVTAISATAFTKNKTMKKLTLGDNVTDFGMIFFGNQNLTDVTLGKGIKTISERAFSACTKLENVTISDGTESIDKYAFFGCSALKSVTIAGSVKSIGEWAFENCSKLEAVYITDVAGWCSIAFNGVKSNPLYYAKNLYISGELATEIEIPAEVTAIGKYAFYNCENLAKLMLHDNITSMGDSCIAGCTSLQYNEYDNALYLGGENNPYLVLIKAKNHEIESCEINTATNEIYSYAFSECIALSEIVIPDSVTKVGESAFAGCKTLSTVSLGKGINAIGNYAFSACGALTKIVIPENVTSISSCAFLDCVSLSDVTLGENVTTIGDSAFKGCTSIVNITIPNGVTKLGNSAFDHCTSLSTIAIPESVTEIGDYLFSGCTSLVTASIPEGFTYIGNYMFANCSSLIGILIPSTITKIGDQAFQYCETLYTINFPVGLIEIGNGAFFECTTLRDIFIPDTVTTIGTSAFENCSKLRKVNIPNSVVSIGNSAFYNCKKLQCTSYNGGEYLGNDTNPFLVLLRMEDTSLLYYSVHKDTQYIHSSAFDKCYDLKIVILPVGIKSIGIVAFYDCESLTDVYYRGTEEQWDAVSVGAWNQYFKDAAVKFNYTE